MGKKPFAIGRLMKKRMKLIYCDCKFLPSLDCLNFLHIPRAVARIFPGGGGGGGRSDFCRRNDLF